MTLSSGITFCELKEYWTWADSMLLNFRQLYEILSSFMHMHTRARAHILKTAVPLPMTTCENVQANKVIA